MKTNLKELSKDDLTLFMANLGQKPFRARQILDWIYKRLATSVDEMTDLSKDLRERLKSAAELSNLTILEKQTSEDGTEKYLFELDDGNTIESVLIPNNKGDRKYTLCISSQVGCAMGCKFCVTAGLGFKRNLKAHEIVDQVITVTREINRLCPDDDKAGITNIVYMGMGEPFNNFKEVIRSVNTLMELMEYSKRRITVSTSGIVPRIQEFSKEVPGVNLAVSLNATTDESRERVMPVNRKYPLSALMQACREFRLPPNRRITFEYVMLGGLNDSKEDAERLIGMLKGMRAKVNLIPFNPGRSDSDESICKQPSDSSVLAFHKRLHAAGITSTIRKSKGSDIAAACGQLKAAYLTD